MSWARPKGNLHPTNSSANTKLFTEVTIEIVCVLFLGSLGTWLASVFGAVPFSIEYHFSICSCTKDNLQHLWIYCQTRMHSSRMRTGRALTVSGAGGGRRVCIPEEFFGGKINWKKKEKKNSDTPPKILSRPPPENLGQTPPWKFGSDNPPPKIWVRHPPPKIWVRHPPKFGSDTPRKFGSDTPPENLGQTPPSRKFGSGTPPVWTDTRL